jgi:uncharacterized protein (DUF1810 family)
MSELKSGRKKTHWISLIFLQDEGLGHSSMARHFAIHSRDEAVAYLEAAAKHQYSRRLAISKKVIRRRNCKES